MTATDPTDALLALGRLAREAAREAGAETALWQFTRALPSLMGARPPLPAGEARQFAAVAFMLTPDERHHLVVAPVNFQPEQWHERVAVTLGHPAHVRQTGAPLLLRDTAHHPSFVKILQTFRARSSMFAPLCLGGALSRHADLRLFGGRDLFGGRSRGARDRRQPPLPHLDRPWRAGLDALARLCPPARACRGAERRLGADPMTAPSHPQPA